MNSASTKPDIRAVLEFYGAAFVPEGARWRAMRCPFHDDRHASASVNTDAGAFTCHACSIKGDGYAVVMAREGCDFARAKQFLAERVGVECEAVSGTARLERARWGVPADPGAVPGQLSIMDARPRWRA